MPVLWGKVVDPDTGETFSIVRDSQSGAYVTSPVPSNLDHYYTANYHGNRHGFTAKYCDWRRARIMLRALAESRRIAGSTNDRCAINENEVRWLDVGCGDGTLLERIRELGWVARGVERFPEAARERGLTVFNTLEDAIDHGPYDGVSLWHVLEHLVDPNQQLLVIKELLKPTGVLLVAVPDASSIAARFFGPDWLHWDVPRHLYHYTPKSLENLMSRIGFSSQQLCVSEFEYDLMGFAQSSLNKMGLSQNLFFKIITGRRVALSWPSKWLHLVLGSILCGLFAMPVWIIGRFGRGGTIVVSARHSNHPLKRTGYSGL